MFAKVRKRQGEQIIYDYICNSKGRGNKFLCASVNLNGAQTDEMVCDYLKDYIKPDSHIYALLEELKRKIASGEQESPLEDIERRIADCSVEMDKVVQLIMKPGISEVLQTRLDKKLSELGKNLKILEKERMLLEKNKVEMENKGIQYDMLVQFLSYLKGNFDTLSIQDKRDFIQILVDRLEWDGENLDIFMYGE